MKNQILLIKKRIEKEKSNLKFLMIKGIHLILKAYEENLIYFWDLVFQEFNNVQ